MDSQLKKELLTAGKTNTTFAVDGREDGQGYLSDKNTTSKMV
jgi:hypothetical protein